MTAIEKNDKIQKLEVMFLLRIYQKKKLERNFN